jgi:hypothetical protein
MALPLKLTRNHHLVFSHHKVEGCECGVHLAEGDAGKPPTYGPVSHIILEDIVIRNPQFTAVDCTPGPCTYLTMRRLEISGAGLRGEPPFGRPCGLPFSAWAPLSRKRRV